MPRIRWSLLFSGIQAVCSIALALLAIWAFFFSSLSQNLEESLRTDATLAKQELLTVRDNTARLESERARLLASLTTLTNARDGLRAEIAGLEGQLQALKADRSSYAQSARLVAHDRFLAMVRFELSALRKVAEICANYLDHRRWIESRRELAHLDEQWETLPFEKQYDDMLPINQRRAKLEQYRFGPPTLWRGMPTKPAMSAAEDQVVMTAHDVKLLNWEKFEELHSYLVAWLLDRIVVSDKNPALTGAMFVAQIKRYDFLSTLLPQERREFDAALDKFLESNPALRDARLNVTTGPAPSPEMIVAAGAQQLPKTRHFEEQFLRHLVDVGISAVHSPNVAD